MSPNTPKACPVKVNFPHKDQMSSFMHEFIDYMVDIACDGHCGLYTVASLREMSVEDYQMIYYQLLK